MGFLNKFKFTREFLLKTEERINIKKGISAVQVSAKVASQSITGKLSKLSAACCKVTGNAREFHQKLTSKVQPFLNLTSTPSQIAISNEKGTFNDVEINLDSEEVLNEPIGPDREPNVCLLADSNQNSNPKLLISISPVSESFYMSDNMSESTAGSNETHKIVPGISTPTSLLGQVNRTLCNVEFEDGITKSENGLGYYPDKHIEHPAHTKLSKDLLSKSQISLCSKYHYLACELDEDDRIFGNVLITFGVFSCFYNKLNPNTAAYRFTWCLGCKYLAMREITGGNFSSEVEMIWHVFCHDPGPNTSLWNNDLLFRVDDSSFSPYRRNKI